MKKLSLIILLFTFITAPAQVRFKQLSLAEALKEASTTGKLVFAQYVTEQCEACNEVADKAFADVELGKFVEQKCIPIKIEVDSKDRLDFTKRFPTIYTMGTYFILGNGDLIHRFTKTISKPSAYSDEINAA